MRIVKDKPTSREASFKEDKNEDSKPYEIEEKFVKVMHLGTTKEMWDKLINSYEGNEKVKDAKLQTYRIQFE